MKNLIPSLALLSLLLFVTTAWSNEYPAIDITELKSAIEQGEVTVIDVNGSTIYRKGHIPTAIDYRKQKDKLETLLPKDKEALIVAYCGGPECNAYLAAAEKAAKLGYRNIRHLSGGIVGWIQAGEALEKAE